MKVETLSVACAAPGDHKQYNWPVGATIDLPEDEVVLLEKAGAVRRLTAKPPAKIDIKELGGGDADPSTTGKESTTSKQSSAGHTRPAHN